MSTWLRGSRLGLVVMALVVGAGAGRRCRRVSVADICHYMAGHRARAVRPAGPDRQLASALGWESDSSFLIPVIGGLLYGPLIQRFAREARGHGVPEVMLAVAENGGRIRPQVSVVKALASALCIGTGGSVGREGPIVQIGSAFASSLGQLVKMSESRLRIIVACGAAGGIAATFNAPLTGRLLRVRDRPARVLARRPVRHRAVRRHRRSRQSRLLRFGALLHADTARSLDRPRFQLPADRSSSGIWPASSESGSRRFSTDSRMSPTASGRVDRSGPSRRWVVSHSVRFSSLYPRCTAWVTR